MRACLFAIAAAFATPLALADESAQHRISAKPIERSAPRYPVHELRRNQQGWVVLNYVVTDDGRVVEPVVAQSSGSRAFEGTAMYTVKTWRFEPARLNGEPVQPCKTKVRIALAMKGAEAKVCWPFYAKYRKMENTLDESDVDDATAALHTASASEGLSLAEMSWLWAFQARLAGIEGDRAPQLAALRRATAGSSQ